MAGVDEVVLQRWRSLPASQVLALISNHAKRDDSFDPITSKNTERWHANVLAREYELITDGPKFFDTRANKGGGGAIDLVMYLHKANFKNATTVLRNLGV